MKASYLNAAELAALLHLFSLAAQSNFDQVVSIANRQHDEIQRLRSEIAALRQPVIA